MDDNGFGMNVLDFAFTAIAVVLCLVFGVVVLPIAGIVLGVRWIWRRTHQDKALKAPNSSQAYAYLEEDATQESVTKIVQEYVDDAVLGPIAQDVLNSFETAGLRHKGIFSILGQEFDKNSLTWDKFSAPVEVAMDTILHNVVQIANRLQAFDSKEYQRMGRLQRAGAYKEDALEVKRLRVMASSLDEMGDIQAANDKLLAELEQLQAELTKMTGAGYGTETDEIAAEISKLAEETKYYA